MVGIREYSETDRSWTTLFLVGIVFAVCILLIYLGGNFSENDISNISSSRFLSTPAIGLFRALASLACICTIASIVLDPKGMTYNLLDYKTRIYGPKRITGTTRLSAFTMWSFTLMGVYFAVSSLSSWSYHFGWGFSEMVVELVPALFASAIASAFLVTTTVTYMLIPEANSRSDDISHYFKWDSQLMHNGNVIFILAELVFSDISLSLGHISFPVVFGCTYVLFSAFNAKRSGIYFYDFIDPRLNGSHIIHMVLLGVLSLLFVLTVAIQEIEKLNIWAYLVVISAIAYLVTTFSNPSEKGD